MAVTMVSHEYVRDDNLPMWHGWHAFRRGLASTLYGLGVDDVMVQQILRHKDVQRDARRITSRPHRIKVSPQWPSWNLLCPHCALIVR